VEPRAEPWVTDSAKRRSPEGAAEIIRDVAQAPDGSVWLLEDANPGALIHVTPK
jgi:glucose/arabinose dehydrogenase